MTTNAPELVVTSVEFHVLPMKTRFPFKYGIASMSALPHLFVTVNLVVDGKAVSGLASEGLPPKWFTKNPDTLFEIDLAVSGEPPRFDSPHSRHAG